MQIIANAQNKRCNTVEDFKNFSSQTLATPAKKENSFFQIVAIEKAFELRGDDMVEISTEDESLKNRKGSYVEKRLEVSIAKLLKQIGDEKRANLIMYKMHRIKNLK